MSLIFLPLIAVAVVAMVLSFAFSGSETVLLTARRHELREQAGHRPELVALLQFIETPRRFLATILIGNMAANNIFSAIGAYLLLYWIGIRDEFIRSIILTLILLWFCELTPKTLALGRGTALAFRTSSFLQTVYYLLYPVILPITWVAQRLVRSGDTTIFVSREELQLLVGSGNPTHQSEMQKRRMMEDILEFAQETAEDIMVPLSEVISFSVEGTVGDIRSEISDSTFTRYPLFRRRSDNLVGYLEVRNILIYPDATPLSLMAKAPLFVPEICRLTDLLDRMNREDCPLAVVVNEYGSAEGIITLTDLAGAIVGSVEDEFALRPEVHKVDGDGTLLVNGLIEVEYLNEHHHLDIPDGDYRTLAGFLIDLARSLPVVGTRLESGDWVFTVVDASDRQVKLVRVEKSEKGITKRV